MKAAGGRDRAPALAEILEEAQRLNPGGALAISEAAAGAAASRAEKIARAAVLSRGRPGEGGEKKLDDILTSRAFGFPAMLLLLAAVFWVTLAGANYPSEVLAGLFSRGKEALAGLFRLAHAPAWITAFFVDGVYLCTAWVVAVMLPPMAIFFPCFTLLEDAGYLPRAAFNLDALFKKAGAHGKQSLTMSMGFGCNAAGVISCRIIESPRERLIAMLTNTFVPCNGRFPALAALAGLLAAGTPGASLAAALAVTGTVVLGAAAALAVSLVLSKTLLKGVPSFFVLELPPYRKPQPGRIIVRSLGDRTLFVLRRAVCAAAPAGAVIWLLANVQAGGQSVLQYLAGLLDPFARLLGLDGHILLAFFLGLPANELVLPILIMSYQAAGSLAEPGGAETLYRLLVAGHGWTWLTAVCTMLFSLLHFPCATTLLTISKEAGGLRWAALGALLPLALACAVCFALAQAARLLGWA